MNHGETQMKLHRAFCEVKSQTNKERINGAPPTSDKQKPLWEAQQTLKVLYDLQILPGEGKARKFSPIHKGVHMHTCSCPLQ